MNDDYVECSKDGNAYQQMNDESSMDVSIHSDENEKIGFKKRVTKVIYR